MKRMILTVMAVLTMSVTFAEDENLNKTESMQAYNMEVNYARLGDALNLSEDQLEAVRDVHKEFCVNMMSVAAASKESRQAMMMNAIRMDLGHMRGILDQKQYKRYLLLLNTTLANRGLR